MKQLHQRIISWGEQINPGLVLTTAVALNVAWLIILSAIDTQFRQLSGYPLLDLQNSFSPDTMMTPTKMREQIATYGQDTKTLYWSFFMLDNIMPPLTFGSIALLWVYLLQRNPNRLFNRFLDSYLVLLPLGVGVFDWLENLGYIAAIHTTSSVGMTIAIYAGLTFKWIKAACVVPTFSILLVLSLVHGVHYVRRAGRMPVPVKTR